MPEPSLKEIQKEIKDFNLKNRKKAKLSLIKKFGGAKDDVIIPKEEFVEEHKNLIALLAKVAVEGSKQKKELNKILKKKPNKGGKLNDCPAGYTTYPLTCTNWKVFPAKTIGRLNVKETDEEIKNAFKKLGEGIMVVLNKDKEFFEDVGRGLLKIFNIPEELWVENVFKPIDNKLKDTIYSADWWRKTMSDPKTYIFLVSCALKIAAMGVCGPACAYAAENVKNIGYLVVDLVNGKNPDTEQIIDLFLGLIPEGGAFNNEHALHDLPAVLQLKKLAEGVHGMSDARRATLIGKNLFETGKMVKSGYEFIVGSKEGEEGEEGEEGKPSEQENKEEKPAEQGNKEAEKYEPVVNEDKNQIQLIKDYVEELNNAYTTKTDYEYEVDANALKAQIVSALQYFKDTKYLISVDLNKLKDKNLYNYFLTELKRIRSGGRRSKKSKDQKTIAKY